MSLGRFRKAVIVRPMVGLSKGPLGLHLITMSVACGKLLSECHEANSQSKHEPGLVSASYGGAYRSSGGGVTHELQAIAYETAIIRV
jgi:hypothetical protein